MISMNVDVLNQFDLFFAQANKKFEDIRYEKEDWSRIKSEMPLEQLPGLGRNSSVLFCFH